jgi:hypothetical protein
MQETLRRIIESTNARSLPFSHHRWERVDTSRLYPNTIDINLLVEGEKRSKWIDLIRELGLRLFHGTGAFAQIEAVEAGDPGIDLMLVDS